MAKHEPRAFGELLRSHRLEAGLTQEALAEEAGLSARCIVDLERGARRFPYRNTVQRLVESLHLTPEEGAAIVKAGRRVGGPEHLPPELPRPSLPAPLTSFIGREREVAELRRLVGTTRLLTLTGAGGIGKTRLALEVSRACAGDLTDEVTFVELAALADESLVSRTVAAALGLHEQPGRPVLAMLIDHFRPRQALLVLDNCEHVVGACAEVADALLRACPNLRILATSRERLAILGEIAWRVPSLSLPDPGAPAPSEPSRQPEAVRLFVERAANALAGFAVTDRNGPAVAAVCHRLDGIPLAIELAAARVNFLGLEGIAGRLDDELRLLSGAHRTSPNRQQTLRATIDWSYRLLPDQERQLFDLLSVFAGGWTLAAAEQTCGSVGIDAGEVLGLLERLVDKSLVMAESQSDGMSVRYRLLEALRQYGAEHLAAAGQLDATRRGHAGYFLSLAERGDPAKLGAGWWPGWRERLRPEQDNFRAALRWLIGQGETTGSQRLGAALARFWLTDNHLSEGRAWLAELLALPGGVERTTTGAEALIAAGMLASFQGDYAASGSPLKEGLAIARELGDSGVLAHALYRLAERAWMRGDYSSARALSAEAVSSSRTAGHRSLEGLSLFIEGVVAYDQADCTIACARLEESLKIFTAEGHPVGAGMAVTHLGWVHHQQGAYASARALLEEGLARYRATEFHFGAAYALNGLGWVATDEGDLWRAGMLFAESVALGRKIGARGRLLETVAGLARLAAARGEPVRTLRLAGAAAALREAHAAPASPVLLADLERSLATARATLPASKAASAWAAGQTLSLEQAITEGLAAAETQAVRSLEPATMGDLMTSLTRREREVVTLAARGLNNRQIAEQLVISEGTARVHVEHILAKLDLHSRAQLAAWAVQHGHFSVLFQ